jgi:NTP pyrophosphatase (non-canonical NTP hydrolase)
MKASEFELLQKAIRVYGTVAQTDMAIEEMGELIVAINHYQRGRVGMDAVQEEIADVMIAMKQLAIIYGESGVEIFSEKKMQRLEQRLKDK